MTSIAPTMWTRFRDRYGKLPPGVQLIGLQMWLPVMFVLAFCLCYVAAFHSPAPHDVPVAIVGSGDAVRGLAASLQTNGHGALLTSVSPTLAAAEQQVRTGALAAAYVPGTPHAELVVASGAQYQLATLAKTFFAPVATAQHADLVVHDLAPLPAADAFGTSLFYVTLVWIIGSYMPALFVGLMGGALRHRVRIGIIVGASIALSLLSTVLVRFVLQAVGAHFWTLWLIGAATGVAVGLVVNGLSYFTGRYIAGAALVLFVFLNVPSSGGAYPPELLPPFFAGLHPFVIGTATIDLLRLTVYGVGPAIWQGLVLLLAYAAVGVVLTVTGRRMAVRRQERRTARAARPPMMVEAQRAAMGWTDPSAPAVPAGGDVAEEEAVAAITGAEGAAGR